MKHHSIYIIIAYALCAGSLCSAMKNTKQQHPIKEITALNKPRFIKFLTNNKAVIAGEDGCYVVGSLTNKKIKRITFFPCSNVITSPSKQKIAIFSNQTLKVYDTKTYEQEWSIKKNLQFESAIFNPKDTTILVQYFNGLHHDSEIYDYQKNECDSTVSYSEDYINKLHSFYENNNLEINDEKLFPNFEENLKNFEICNLVNTQTCSRNLILTGLFKSSLTENTYCLRYWNIKTEKLIYEDLISNCKICYDFSFSPDKKQVMIVLDDKCINLNVPWEIVKVNELFTYWALKNYQINLSTDIIILLLAAMRALPE